MVRRHPETGERHLDLLKCGLLLSRSKHPAKAQRPINAMAETVATSGLFRGAFKAPRCIVPADELYKWKAAETRKQPYAIAVRQPMAFAGLWEGTKLAERHDRPDLHDRHLQPQRGPGRAA